MRDGSIQDFQISASSEHPDYPTPQARPDATGWCSFPYSTPQEEFLQVRIIRIYHECEGRIEKSVLRITIWHHKAGRVMTNGDLEGQIFLSYPHTNNELCFLAHHCFYSFIY